jgi:RimJ/RimL family protein N-acetyltransferase
VTTSSDCVLQSERVFLRKFRPDEANLFFDLDSDPEVMRFITKGVATPLALIENEIMPRVLGYYAHHPPQGAWAAHLLATGEFFGWFHLRPDKIEPEEMELGYRLKRKVWGRGLATEVSQALLQAAFQQWQYPKVSARTLVGNHASQRVMQKVGLKFEKEFIYPVSIIPEWPETDRRAVKYSLCRPGTP